jgi:hypothetical protein
MKKEATLRARVPKHIAEMVGEQCLTTGECLANYTRTALLEKLAKDRQTTVKALLTKG